MEVFHPKDITNFGILWPLLSEVCHDVVIEPELQSLTGESFHYQSTPTKMKPALMSGPRVSVGIETLRNALMSKSLIPMLSPTESIHCLLPFVS